MRLTIAYSKIKKRNLVLINNDAHKRETLSERLIGQPLSWNENWCAIDNHDYMCPICAKELLDLHFN